MWVLRTLIGNRWICVVCHVHGILTLIISFLAIMLHIVRNDAWLLVGYLSILNTYIQCSLHLVCLLNLCVVVLVSAFDTFSIIWCHLMMTSIITPPHIFERYVILLDIDLLISCIVNKGLHLRLTLFVGIIKAIESVCSW